MKTIRLSKWQTAVLNDTHRYKVINCGRRAGKSFLVSLAMLEFASKHEGSVVWFVAPTYRQAKLIMWAMLADLIPPEIILKKNESDLSMELINHSHIVLKGADNPDSLRGVRIDFAVFDETAFITKWETVWKVVRPTLIDSKADCWFISTPNGFNHFKELYDTQHEDWRSFHFTSYDNPYLDREEIDSAKHSLTEDAFAQEFMGEFKRMTGLVYKEFSRDIHVVEMEFTPVYWLVGCDRGFTNPTAIPFIQVDKDGNWYQTQEIYQSGLTNLMLNDLFNEIAPVKEFEMETMDSAQAGDIAELNSMGRSFIPVVKEARESNQSYVPWKIQKFAQRLKVNQQGKPSYYVHPRCVNTIGEFERYRYPELKVEQNQSEVPMKVDDHMMDALADLNAMYEHFYSPKEKKPWEGKLPGTYVPPSVPDGEENQWGGETSWL